MSRFEEEEEDELQLILEGRDVAPEDYESDDRSERSASEEEEEVRDRQISQKVTIKRQTKSVDRKRRSPLIPDDYDEPIAAKKKRPDNTIDKELTSDVINNKETESTEAEVKKKVRRIRANPLPALNPQKLMSANGIAALPEVFSGIKFAGKGSELKDLNAIMFRLSHWSHRLFPSLTFDDFIDKCEQLGRKKNVNVFVHKIRYDLPLNLVGDNVVEQKDDDNQNEDNEDKEPDFDDLLDGYNKFVDKKTVDEFDSDFSDIDIDIGDKDKNKELEPIGNSDSQTVREKQTSDSIDDNEESEAFKGEKSIDGQQDVGGKTSDNIVDNRMADNNENEELDEEDILKEINSDDE